MVQTRIKSQPRERIKYVPAQKKFGKISSWTKVAEKVSMLLESIKISRLTPLQAERDSKIATEMCIIAPIYCQLCEENLNTWTPDILTRIKETAYELHLKTKVLFKIETLKAARLKPNSIFPQFLVKSNKVEIVVRNPSALGTNSENIDLDEIEKHMTENDAVILCTDNKRFISFWRTKRHQFVAYSPPQGFGNRLEYSFLIISEMLKDIYTYLKHTIKFEGAYELFILEVLKREPVAWNVEQMLKKREGRMLKRIQDVDTPVMGDGDKVLEENEKDVVVPGEPIEMDDIDRTKDLYRIPFSKDYANHYYDDRGFLSASIGFYVKDPKKIIHCNIAAAMYLHHIRAALWMHQTIDDIFRFSDNLYNQSVESGICEDVYWISRIPNPIQFGAKRFKLIYEKIVIGDITTEENYVFSVKQGITAFFKHSDLGIIYGSQPQLIWQEAGLYYTFSPKERDPVGRKWTRVLTSRLAGNMDSSELSQQGAACVSWFKDLPSLCDAYLANITLKHRKDQYRIVKIKIVEQEDKSEDCNNWKSYAPGKWRIIGDKSICHYVLNNETVGSQMFSKSFSMACANSLYAKVYDSDVWAPANIDEILSYGNDYYKESVHEKPELLKEFNYKNLKRTFILADKRFQIVIAANKYQGQVFYSKGSTPDLAKALKLYFDDYQFGLVLVGDRILPIFQMNSYYHLIFVYDKVFGKTEQCACSPESIYGDVYGHAFALRFKDIAKMHEEILTIMSLNDDEKYSLYIVEGKDRPPLLNYTKFGENAAILRPNDNLHEGSSIFNVRADKQTYANLLVALCYVNMSRPLEWSVEDIADLLRTGDSIYCKLTANIADCSEIFFKLKLEAVIPHIGWNKFSYRAEQEQGIFKLYPMEGDEENDHEDEVEEEEEDAIATEGGGERLVPHQLSQILSGWDQMEQVLAILDSRAIKLALWKKDLVYFVFDPKASLQDGKMTSRRIHRIATTIEFGENDITDLRNIANEGTSYVAYFYDLESFIEHLLSCVPREYHSELFTLHRLTITCPPVPQAELATKYQPNTEFVITAPNVSIIRATMSQDETMFQNPNKQEISNCMVAIAFAYITPPSKWTSELLNIVMKYGDRLYVKSLDRLEKYDRERFSNLANQPMAVEDMVQLINIYKVRFKFSKVAKISNCINPDAEANKDLKKQFGQLQNVDNGSGGIVRIKDRTNAVWKTGGTFFLFDPFKCDPCGLGATNGVACLMRFNKFELFIDFFAKKYLCKSGPNNFEMVLLSCEKSMPSSIPGFYMDKYNFTQRRPSNQLQFEEIDNGMKMLKRRVDFTSKSAKFLCLAALLHSRVEYVELWNFSVFVKIMLLADFLQLQLDSKTSQPNSHHLEDINFSVKIDSVLCNIVVHHVVVVTPQTEVESKNLNLRQGLHGFFLEHNNCVVTSREKCYAIWNEGPKYYMLWYRATDTRIVVLVSQGWEHFYDIILTESGGSSSPFYIKEAIITRIKIWDACKKGEKGEGSTRRGVYDEECRQCNFERFVEDYTCRNVQRSRFNAQFKPYCQGVDVLCGNLIKSNEFFSNDLFFCESLKACCMVAAAMSLITSPENWTKNTLGEIVLAGNDLFKSTIAVARKTQFEIDEYETDMNLMGYNLSVRAEQPTAENMDENSLLNPLVYILQKHKYAYLGAMNQFWVTIIKESEVFYMFYAGSTAVCLNDVENETVCLVRADTIHRLVTFIAEKSQTTNSVLVGAIDAKFS